MGVVVADKIPAEPQPGMVSVLCEHGARGVTLRELLRAQGPTNQHPSFTAVRNAQGSQVDSHVYLEFLT